MSAYQQNFKAVTTAIDAIEGDASIATPQKMQMLQQMLQRYPGYSGPILAAMNNMKQTQTAAQGVQPQQPSVAQQVLAKAPIETPQAMAKGGIVAFKQGGKVRKFADRGLAENMLNESGEYAPVDLGYAPDYLSDRQGFMRRQLAAAQQYRTAQQIQQEAARRKALAGRYLPTGGTALEREDREKAYAAQQARLRAGIEASPYRGVGYSATGEMIRPPNATMPATTPNDSTSDTQLAAALARAAPVTAAGAAPSITAQDILRRQGVGEGVKTVPTTTQGAPDLESPDVRAERLYKFLKPEERVAERDTSRDLALLQAGLGIMGGESPFAMVNIGKGAQTGLGAYAELQKERRKEAQDYERAVQEARKTAGVLSLQEYGADVRAARQMASQERQMRYQIDKTAAMQAAQNNTTLARELGGIVASYDKAATEADNYYKILQASPGADVTVLAQAKQQRDYAVSAAAAARKSWAAHTGVKGIGDIPAYSPFTATLPPGAAVATNPFMPAAR